MTTRDQIRADGTHPRGAAELPRNRPSSDDRRADSGGPGRTAPSWPGFAAAAVAFTFAAVSFYWGLGGKAGLSTLGPRFEQAANDRDPLIVTLVLVTGALKVLGGLLALALVQPWGRKLPRRWLLLAAWSGAVLLTVYGVLQVSVVALVKFGVVAAADPGSSTVLLWRLLLWEPWFVVWGALLGLTAWYARKRPIDTDHR